MAALLTLPVPELPGLLREAIRSALVTHAHESAAEYWDRRISAIGNSVAQALVLHTTGQRELPALTSGQLLTIVTALDQARVRVSSLARASSSSPALDALIEELTDLRDTFDALMIGDGVTDAELDVLLGDAPGPAADLKAAARASGRIPEPTINAKVCAAINAGENEYRVKVLGQKPVGNVIEPETTPWGLGDQSEVSK